MNICLSKWIFRQNVKRKISQKSSVGRTVVPISSSLDDPIKWISAAIFTLSPKYSPMSWVMSKRCDKILSRKFQLIVNCFQFYLPKVLIIVGSSFSIVKNSSCLHHWISKLCLKAWICRFEIIFMQQSMWISFIFVRNHLPFSLLLLNIFVFKIY